MLKLYIFGYLNRVQSSRRILVHWPEIVLGVLEVVLCGDPVAGQGFGASQRQVAFVVPLRVLRIPRMLVANPFRFGLSDLRCSRPHIAGRFPMWTRLCSRVFAFRWCRHVSPYRRAGASRATLALRIVRYGGRRLRCNGAAFPQLGFGRTDVPYVGSQNVDFNIICRSNGFRATARSCLSCWKILVPIAAVRRFTLAFTGGDAFDILPASRCPELCWGWHGRYVRAGCRSCEAGKVPG